MSQLDVFAAARYEQRHPLSKWADAPAAEQDVVRAEVRTDLKQLAVLLDVEGWAFAPPALTDDQARKVAEAVPMNAAGQMMVLAPETVQAVFRACLAQVQQRTLP